MNRTRKSIKILNWQKEGFVLYNKNLELGHYNLFSSFKEEAFGKVERDTLNEIIHSVKHKSNTNELRQKAMITF